MIRHTAFAVFVVLIVSVSVSQGTEYDFVERGLVALPRSGPPEYAIYPGMTAVINGYAYVSRGAEGTFVVDARNVRAPRYVGEVANGFGRSVAVIGEVLWAASSQRLTAFDVTNPEQPLAMGSCSIPGGIQNFSIAGSTIYVNEEAGGLQIVDATNPQSPVLRGRCALPPHWAGFAISGNHALVPDRSDGLIIVDVRDPASPVRVGSFNTGRAGRSVAAIGMTAYLADESFLSAIDFTDVSSPRLLWEIYEDLAGAVAVSGNRVFVSRGERGLICYDVSNPISQWLGGYDPDFLATTTVGMTISEGYGFVTLGRLLSETGELAIVDLENGANLERVAPLSSYPAYAGKVVGARVYLVESIEASRFLRIYEPDASGALRRVGEADAATAHELEISNGFAFLAGVNVNGINVFDVSNSALPRAVGAIAPGTIVWGLAVSGNALFSVNGRGLQVYDVSSPGHPQIAALATGGRQIDVADGFAYIAEESGVIIDVRNPRQAQVVASGLPFASAIAVQHGFAYFGNGEDSGIGVLDVRIPTAPRQIATLRLGAYIVRLSVSGRYLYASGYRGELHVIDVSDPARPLRVGGNSRMSESAIGTGFIIANVSNGSAIYRMPELRMRIEAGPAPTGIAVTGPAGLVGRLQFTTELREWIAGDQLTLGWGELLEPETFATEGNKFWKFVVEGTDRVPLR